MSQASPAPTERNGRRLVSVVIVNWNTAGLLRQCLTSLPCASASVDLEVIVVDNGSTDDSVAMMRRDFPQVRLVANETNVGFVKANNQGLAVATGAYLLMLNSDTEVSAGAIERLVEVAAGNPLIGAVGPRLLNTDGTPQVSAGPFPSALYRFLPSRFEAAYNRRLERRLLRHPRHLAEVGWLSGAALLFRRDVLERVGPLDERYYMWYDDLDWSQKLRKAGYQRVLVAEAVITHHGRQSGRKLDNRSLAEQLFTSEYTYLRLHHGRLTTCLVYGLRIAKALAVRYLSPAAASARKPRGDWPTIGAIAAASWELMSRLGGPSDGAPYAVSHNAELQPWPLPATVAGGHRHAVAAAGRVHHPGRWLDRQQPGDH